MLHVIYHLICLKAVLFITEAVFASNFYRKRVFFYVDKIWNCL